MDSVLDGLDVLLFEVMLEIAIKWFHHDDMRPSNK